ncbi:MAG: NADH-quinone oxidoreductase subunit H [Betaproteobacteria bacterium]|nr:NADH-quinone oxidoreductase subunit H [Betaproteobacteria bacterium]
MTLLLMAVHTSLLLVMPFVLIGVINRTKAWWGGRKGPGLLQSFWDMRRLLYKRPVYSTTTTAVFRSGAYLVVVSAVVAGLIAPLLGGVAAMQFRYDFVVFAYTLGLGRMAMMLSAMDVGSAFEGMGSAREASFSAFVEPALFILIGSASIATGQTSFAGLIGQWHHSPQFGLVIVPAMLALLILLQTEAARVPVDDPTTHLELTMVHEVMLLDHSGPDLAAMQFAAALKLTTYAGLMAALLNPFDPAQDLAAAAVTSVMLMLLVAVLVGCVESLMARLRMRWVPRYLLVAGGAALICLAVVTWGEHLS